MIPTVIGETQHVKHMMYQVRGKEVFFLLNLNLHSYLLSPVVNLQRVAGSINSFSHWSPIYVFVLSLVLKGFFPFQILEQAYYLLPYVLTKSPFLNIPVRFKMKNKNLHSNLRF